MRNIAEMNAAHFSLTRSSSAAATNSQIRLPMKAGGFFWALGLVFFLVQGDVCLGRLELTQIPPITIFLLFSVPLVIYAWLSRGAFVYAAMSIRRTSRKRGRISAAAISIRVHLTTSTPTTSNA